MPPSNPSINNKNRRRTMKTKTIFNLLAFAMLTAAMVLTTACSGSDDIAVNKPETTEPTEPVAKKGYELPVTINVTRQGDDATRASYDENTGILSFSTGDKLFVNGAHGDAGLFGGTLTYDGGTTFSGTITTKNAYSGTADALFSSAQTVAAQLLPNDYGTYGYFSVNENYGYDASLNCNKGNAFATTKALAVEQFCKEWVGSYYNGFQLTPCNAILNFTIYPLTATGNVTISFTGINDVSINKEVTVDDDGKVTFAIGVDGYTNLNQYALTVGGNTIYLGSHALAAGHIYNITRYANTISGKFSVSATKQVYFSKGNLQATYNNNAWSWGFAPNQWNHVGNNSANTNITGNGSVSTEGVGAPVDLFGWSTSKTYLGIHNSTNNDDYSGDFVEWGSHADVTKSIGTGWRTLTGSEWNYLIQSRSTSSGIRYCKAKVGSDFGLILLPDDWNAENYTLVDYNETSNRDFNDGSINNKISTEDWTSKLEANGAVFLPTTGQRNTGNVVDAPNGRLYYWSSTKGTVDSGENTNAVRMTIAGTWFKTNEAGGRRFGYAVRLVRDVK